MAVFNYSYGILFFMCKLMSMVEGEGKFEIRLLKYDNPSGTYSSGQCCDGVSRFRTDCSGGGCNHRFTICVSDSASPEFTCDFGKHAVTAPNNQNSIILSESESASATFSLKNWPIHGSVTVQVTVDDLDTNATNVHSVNQLVDTFTTTINVGASGFNRIASVPKTETLTAIGDISASQVPPSSLQFDYTVFYEAYDSYYLPKGQNRSCCGMNECGNHYWCEQDGHQICLYGWEGPDCNTPTPGGRADCSIDADVQEFYPSEWLGGYRCPSDWSVTTPVTFNATQSQSNIVSGEIYIQQQKVSVIGYYEQFIKHLTLQNKQMGFSYGGRFFEEIELSGFLQSSLNIKGTVMLVSPGLCNGSKCNIKEACTLELRRTASHFDGCGGHGQCWRYGPRRNDFMCCCENGYTGDKCENHIAITTPLSTSWTPNIRVTSTGATVNVASSTASATSAATMTITFDTTTATGSTIQTSTIPPTTTASTIVSTVPSNKLAQTDLTPVSCSPISDCNAHFDCGPQGQMLCLPGWTGPQCDIQIPSGKADCEVYDMEEFLPSEWNGNYTCADDNIQVHFVLNFTKSSSSIELAGTMYIDQEELSMTGSFASYFKSFAIQNRDVINVQTANHNFSKVELNGKVQSSVFIHGAIVFWSNNSKKDCDMGLKRQAVFTPTNWCNNHGVCQRYGTKKDEYICCCEHKYTGSYCETEITTNSTTTTTTSTTALPPTTTLACKPVNNCTAHFTCGPQGQKVCLAGWIGVDCDSKIPDGAAECNNFDFDVFIPSTWDGNYTCKDDNTTIRFQMNITESSDTIGTIGNILIDGSTIVVSGSFAAFFKTFALQGQDLVMNSIYKRNFTNVELNGRLVTAVFIEGVIIFELPKGIYTCNMELRRKAVYIDWCSAHGSCYRNGPHRDQISCCCDPGFTGDACNTAVITPRSTELTAVTTPPPTLPTTTLASELCGGAVFNCTMHYDCGHKNEIICVNGYTGRHCENIIPGGDADCDVFDSAEFIPSLWNGNYTCSDDNNLIGFTINISNSLTSIDLIGGMFINNTMVTTQGSFAGNFKVLTLQNYDLITQKIFGRNFTDVELNGMLRSPVFIDGVLILKDNINGKFTCPMELRRVSISVNFNWCNGRGICHRNGRQKNDYTCCCDPGYSGSDCKV